MMSEFYPIPNRDAYASIRGYVYQVDATLKRWLDLEPGEALILECGEDIDKIFNAIPNGHDEFERVLEQVKHREQSITLRTDEIVGAIANFVWYCSRNPGLKLFFRFTTNAQIGLENPKVLDDGQPALEIWQAIHNKHNEAPPIEHLQAINNTLVSRHRPKDTNEDIWNNFIAFLNNADTDLLHGLIQRFEIVNNFSEASLISNELQVSLIEMGYASNNKDAQELYYRLFYRVFRLLSQKGQKRLSYEQLIDEIKVPTLSEVDRQQLERIKSTLVDLLPRIEKLEENQKILGPRLNVLEESVIELFQIQKLQEKAGIDESSKIQYSENVVLTVPHLVQNYSNREDTVDSIISNYKNLTWIALQGSSGWGKTQLAILISQKFEHKIWLGFRDLKGVSAYNRLSSALNVIAENKVGIKKSFSDLCEDACKHLCQDSLVIFDDLPKLQGDDDFSNQLSILVSICVKYKIQILSTSCFNLHSRLREKLSEKVLVELPVPPFTVQETSEVLQAYGGPDSIITTKFSEMVNSITRKHPALIVAFAKYMASREWKHDQEFINCLLSSNYASEVKEETFYRIVQTIENSNSRELLYRLSLASFDFPFGMVSELAQIIPSIERLQESFLPLLGLWIQKEAQNNYRLSPLIHQIGDTELPDERKINCHSKIGQWLIKQRIITPSGALEAIVHFVLAEEFDQAGNLLVYVLYELFYKENQLDDYGILLFWWSTPLPVEMNTGIRIMIRSLQISIGNKQGKKIEHLIDDLCTIVDEIKIGEVFSLYLMIFMNFEILVKKFPLKAYKLLSKALQFINDSKLDPKLRQIISTLQFEHFVWIIIGLNPDKSNTDSWLKLFENLSLEQRKTACSAIDLYETACLQITTAQWLPEANKEESERNWEKVIQNLTALGECAKQINLELLWSWTIFARAVIYGEYLNDLNQARETVELALEKASKDKYVQFVLHEAIGRQYFFADRYSEALRWLLNALEYATDSFHVNAIETAIHVSQCFAYVKPVNHKKSIEYCELAVKYAEMQIKINERSIDDKESEHSLDLPHQLIKSLSELAIARWFIGDILGSFDAWDIAATKLLETKAQDNIFKELFVCFVHVSGYFMSAVMFGKPIEKIPSGEDYIAPKRGMFFNSNPMLIEQFNSKKKHFLPVHLAYFAEAVGRDEKAYEWAIRAETSCRGTAYEYSLIHLSLILLPKMFANSEYKQSLDLMLDSVNSSLSIAQKKGFIFDKDEPLQEIYEAEKCIIDFWSLASTLYLCLLKLQDSEKAINASNKIANAFKETQHRVASTNTWEEFSLFFSSCLTSGINGRELFKKSEQSTEMIIKVQNQIIATVLPNISIRECFIAQLQNLPLIMRFFNEKTIIYRKIIVPFMEKFWIDKITKSRFAIINPDEVIYNLNRAIKTTISERVKNILMAISEGLDIRIPPEYRNWLSEK